MSEHEQANETPSPAQHVSLSRVFKTVVPIVIVLVAGAWAAQTHWQTSAQRDLEASQLGRLLGREGAEPVVYIEFVDGDGDLLADAPTDDKCVTPDKIVFSYVAEEDPGDVAATWQPWLDQLAEATGLPTEYAQFTKVDDQLKALGNGGLHITAVNTGAVPMAVTTAGFIPVCTFGTDGDFGYTMNLIVPAKGSAKEVTDLRGKKITFVRPNSNSGFKAALVYLMSEHDMLPERDYQYGFSMGHDASIQEVANGKTDAAPVASDLFDRMAAAGEVDDSSVRVIYKSERFPPVALGYAYNLAPTLRDAITQQLSDFDWEGTPFGDAYGASGATGFVPVNYKDDWANIRRIDDTIDRARESRQ